MSRNFSDPAHFRTTEISSAGNNFTVIESGLSLQGYRSLQLLKSKMEENRPGRLRVGTLLLSELEMLEAELLNQQVLLGTAPVLVHHAYHEAMNLRWYARRRTRKDIKLTFLVDVPRYILHVALGRSNSHITPAELAYLESFAEFILVNRKGFQNRYQKGLDLILKVLAAPQNKSKNEEQITLPISRDLLLRKLS